ncbi:MAG: SPFH domain-containing protein [Hyphomonadaceae bacterium]|jgi:regulator of protease activity HflC (stomatin/prohibitin superfamily)|nr:SPFH domain-containing protein [Caulobacteraceae bacterium]MBP6690425.1 SPFH domain-containing protein [Hyphomonadaceae bacterium]
MAAAALNRTQERKANTSNGGMMLLLSLVVFAALIWMIVQLIAYENGLNGIGTIVLSIVFVLQLCGFYTLQPNEGAAITLFGNYKGTDRTPGLRWMLPWYTRKKISLRVRNVTGEKLKVNDKRGNPIEIAAVVVWRVTDTAQALFDVDSYQTFVDIQIETAVREIASHFAYDHAEEGEPTLRGDADQVSALLREKLQDRTSVAGVVVDETKLSHLAYAPEIAGAMLRRQQAEAVLSARRYIVQGAVEMVQHALEQLSERDIVQLDDERRAAMVSNLLVVLCGDRDAQPVVNAGSLYS